MQRCFKCAGHHDLLSYIRLPQPTCAYKDSSGDINFKITHVIYSHPEDNGSPLMIIALILSFCAFVFTVTRSQQHEGETTCGERQPMNMEYLVSFFLEKVTSMAYCHQNMYATGNYDPVWDCSALRNAAQLHELHHRGAHL
jgi:hypothetical protein